MVERMRGMRVLDPFSGSMIAEIMATMKDPMLKTMTRRRTMSHTRIKRRIMARLMCGIRIC